MDRFKKQEMRTDSLARVREEIVAERAAALARITQTLEGLLAELRRLRREIETTAGRSSPERVAAYRRVRDRALRYRWYLAVQREVNGLVDAEPIEQRYPVAECLPRERPEQEQASRPTWPKEGTGGGTGGVP